jgi:protein gp37
MNNSNPGIHAIAWTDETWNPLVGCSRYAGEMHPGKPDPACDNCYAAAAAATPRLQQFEQYKGVENWDGTINLAINQLDKPFLWKKPRKIFTCSMSDIFHENISREWQDMIFARMYALPRHTFQVLTKRTDRMEEYFSANDLEYRLLNQLGNIRHDCQITVSDNMVADHIWLGTTCGDQVAINYRLPVLSRLTERGWTTFMSCEPLLEDVDLGLLFPGYKVDQIIVGAESGRKARPMKESWVRHIQQQCVAANVAFFYKQNVVKGKKHRLPFLDGKQYYEFPKH